MSSLIAVGGRVNSRRPPPRSNVLCLTRVSPPRKLLGWERYKLAQRAKVHSSIIERAESVPGEPPITDYQQAFISRGPSCAATSGVAQSVRPGADDVADRKQYGPPQPSRELGRAT